MGGEETGDQAATAHDLPGISSWFNDHDVTWLTKDDVDYLHQRILDDVGITLDQLRAEARRGRFSSVLAHDAWHLILSYPKFEGGRG